jgi:hypothetical protein
VTKGSESTGSAVVLGGSITGLLAARVLRRRVHAIANVRFLDGHDAVRLTAERGRVTGAQTAVSSDLALPQIAGNRTMSVRLSNAAVDRLLAAAETDPAAVRQFLRMMNMVGPRPQSLRPSTILQMIAKPSALTAEASA